MTRATRCVLILRVGASQNDDHSGLTMDWFTGILAICSRDKTQNWVRLFDIGSFKARLTVGLESSAWDARAEIIKPSFSPNGIYLALPRSDNITDIYDTRFMSTERGPILRLPHGPHRTQSAAQMHYGIVAAEWISNQFGCPGLGLVTGGNDGICPSHVHQQGGLMDFQDVSEFGVSIMMIRPTATRS
jgi:hypothetical protein